MLATSLSYISYWWLGVFPGLAIFFAVLAFNMVGDGIRDALDTHSR
jgi:peptide/nickel transport system permease protein